MLPNDQTVDAVTSVAILGAGPVLLVGTASGCVREVAPGFVRGFYGLEGSAIAAVAASRGSIIASSRQRGAMVWSRENQKPVALLASSDPLVQCGELAPDRFLAVDDPGNLQLWTIGPRGIATASAIPVQARKFGIAGDGARVALLNGFAWAVWNPASGAVSEWHRTVRGLELDYLSGDTGLSPDGSFYYVYWDDYIAIDTRENRELRRLPIALHPQCTALSLNGEILAIGGGKGELLAVNAAGETIFREMVGRGAVMRVALSHDGVLAAFIDQEGRCGVYEVPTGRLVLDPQTLFRRLR